VVPWGVFIRELLAALARESCSYCLVGGVAVNLHGIPRMTYDVDLVSSLQPAHLQALTKVFEELALSPRLPVRLTDLVDPSLRARLYQERNLIALTYTDARDPLREVDVLVNPPVQAEDLVSRAMQLDLEGVPVMVASLRDLIALKRASGRPQDLADAAHLERFFEEDE
jgi:predicted nucleotidyltransferase